MNERINKYIGYWQRSSTSTAMPPTSSLWDNITGQKPLLS